MQVKFTRSYYFTSVRMNITGEKNSENNKCWQGYRATGTLVFCWWEYKMAQLLWKAVGQLLKKLKIKLPYDLAIWRMSQRIESKVSKEISVYSSLKQHYSQWLKHGSNPSPLINE